MAGAAGLEPVTSAVTGQRSNQLSYAPALGRAESKEMTFVRQAEHALFRVFEIPRRLNRTGDFRVPYKGPGSRRQGGGGGEPR